MEKLSEPTHEGVESSESVDQLSKSIEVSKIIFYTNLKR